MTVTVLRQDEEPETLALQIDEFGESWVAEGRPVRAEESRAVVALVHQGERYEIELPFLAAPPIPTAPDPHQGHEPLTPRLDDVSRVKPTPSVLVHDRR